MSKWVCPACGGGFPELHVEQASNPAGDTYACPWCEEELTLD